MESPAFIIMAAYLFYFNNLFDNFHFYLFALWLIHYGYRSFFFPLRISNVKKNFPFSVMLMALVFNFLNAYVQGENIVHGVQYYESIDIFNWNVILGTSFFVFGFVTHVHSDHIILDQKKLASGQYIIPQGWLFRFVSNPNYLGEILQWLGWAILLNCIASWSFFLFTLANLWPRAISNHRWYRSKFEDYPVDRKIIIPFIY